MDSSPKNENSFTHILIILNMYDFHSPEKHKRTYLKGTHWRATIASKYLIL